MVSNNMTDSFGEVKNIMANYNDGITETLEKEFNKVEDSFADKTDKIKNNISDLSNQMIEFKY